MQNPDFFDENALLERLTTGVVRNPRPVIFLLGSPITAPRSFADRGVPGVAGVIDLIREEFQDQQLKDLENELQSLSENQYQIAFRYLLGRRGQQVVNDVIKRAVWKARKPVIGQPEHPYMPGGSTSDDVCRALDCDIEGWVLAPAVEAVGKLVAQYPDRFGRAILTTNFDPLLEVAIEKAGSHHFRTTLHRDGNLAQTEGSGCHVIHLHGYWHGTDTLHTPRQLNQPRPRLKASLATLLRGKTLVVSGYGGWDDAFTDALMEVVVDDSSDHEIIWTVRNTQSVFDANLQVKLAPWPAPGFEDTELGVLMEPEVGHGETKIYARVQA